MNVESDRNGFVDLNSGFPEAPAYRFEVIGVGKVWFPKDSLAYQLYGPGPHEGQPMLFRLWFWDGGEPSWWKPLDPDGFINDWTKMEVWVQVDPTNPMGPWMWMDVYTEFQ